LTGATATRYGKLTSRRSVSPSREDLPMQIVETQELVPSCHRPEIVETSELQPTCHS